MNANRSLEELNRLYADYLREEYKDWLKAAKRFSLLDFPLEVQVEILEREKKRAKRSRLSAMRKREGKSLNAYLTTYRPIRVGEFYRANKFLKNLDRLPYLFAYVVENLQEYDEAGNNVTCTNLPELGE